MTNLSQKDLEFWMLEPRFVMEFLSFYLGWQHLYRLGTFGQSTNFRCTGLGVSGGAHQSSAALQDEAHRRLHQQVTQPALVSECLHESTVLHLLEQLGSNASTDIHTADGQDLQCQ